MHTPILMALRPVYADLVFNGLKRAELRRRIPHSMAGRDVFIYVSSPVRHLRGGFKVDKVWTGSPGSVWNQVSALAQVDRETFDSYYAGRSEAFALGISSVWEYKKKLSLNVLRTSFPPFTVPQSWRYMREQELVCLSPDPVLPAPTVDAPRQRSWAQDANPATTAAPPPDCDADGQLPLAL